MLRANLHGVVGSLIEAACVEPLVLSLHGKWECRGWSLLAGDGVLVAFRLLRFWRKEAWTGARKLDVGMLVTVADWCWCRRPWGYGCCCSRQRETRWSMEASAGLGVCPLDSCWWTFVQEARGAGSLGLHGELVRPAWEHLAADLVAAWGLPSAPG